jgi:hypothetical protein
MLAGEIDIGMYNAHVSSEGIRARECLLFLTQCAPDFLLARIMNRILVTRQIVGSREYGVARLARRRVGPLALVRPGLTVPLLQRLRRHAAADARSWDARRLRHMVLTMCLSLVPLQFLRSLKSLGAAVVSASVGASIGEGV